MNPKRTILLAAYRTETHREECPDKSVFSVPPARLMLWQKGKMTEMECKDNECRLVIARGEYAILKVDIL